MKVKNWERFQFYQTHNRAAKMHWIKVYRDLLENPDWFDLTDQEARRLLELWLLASEKRGEIPPVRTVAFRLRITHEEAEKTICALREKGWLVDESATGEGQQGEGRNSSGIHDEFQVNSTGMQPECNRNAKCIPREEKRREEERRERIPRAREDDAWIEKKDVKLLGQCLRSVCPDYAHTKADLDAVAIETHRSIIGAAEIMGNVAAWAAAKRAWEAFCRKSIERPYQRPGSTWLTFLLRQLIEAMPDEETMRRIEATNAAKRRGAIERELTDAQRTAAKTGDNGPLAETIRQLSEKWGVEAVSAVARQQGIDASNLNRLASPHGLVSTAGRCNTAGAWGERLRKDDRRQEREKAI